MTLIFLFGCSCDRYRAVARIWLSAYCGFKPALVICRKNGGENWVMYDNKRSPHQNPNSHVLYMNLTAAEGTSGLPIDFLANGFKMRSTDGNSNSGSTHYFYMAWAETPFKYANAG